MENNFSKNLKRIRTEKLIKQSDLAEKINVKQVTISSWESGRTEPSMGDIARIAEALDCTQEELLGIRKSFGNISFEDVLAKIPQLSIGELQKLNQVVKANLDLQVQIFELERAKAKQEALLLEYTRKLNELNGIKNEN